LCGTCCRRAALEAHRLEQGVVIQPIVVGNIENTFQSLVG
jgi:hypothetical protein